MRGCQLFGKETPKYSCIAGRVGINGESVKMLAALLFHKGNQDQAAALCGRIAKMGGVANHRILLATDTGDCHELWRILEGVFSEVLFYTAHESPEGWPARENALHANVTREIHFIHKCPWLRMEPDSLPLRASWLDEIEAAHKACGKPILAGTSGHPGRFCGVSVFPADVMEHSLQMMIPRSVWYADGCGQLMKQAAVTDLMSEIPTGRTAVRVRSQDAGYGDSDRTCIVQLGRLGDVLNILPVVKRIADTEGKPVLMVHKDYAGIDVDYCDLDVWDRGAWSDLSLAVRDARDKYKRVIVSQIHGDRWQSERKCPSFCIESWRMAGYADEFGALPLVLKRNPIRETDMLIHKTHDVSKEVILVNCNGTSSPFASGHELRQLAEATGRHVVDLSKVRADKFQDILALYDNAGLLITTDTATLHLAQASGIPVIALVADNPTPWHQSAQKGNEILRVKYSDFHKKREAITRAIDAVFNPRKVHHVYQEFSCDGETRRRNDFAQATWNYPAFVTGHPVSRLERDSSHIGDARGLSFIKDIIDSVKAAPSDVIVFTNTDTCLRKGFWWEAMASDVPLHGHRYDFDKLTRPLDATEIPTGKWYPGSDVFVFTKGWWDSVKADFPDMLVGAESWDKIMRSMIIHYGGEETFAACYHEKHAAHWSHRDMRRNDAANRHNRVLAKQWLQAHALPLDELEYFDDDPPEVVAPVKRRDMSDLRILNDILPELIALGEKPRRTRGKRAKMRKDWKMS